MTHKQIGILIILLVVLTLIALGILYVQPQGRKPVSDVLDDSPTEEVEPLVIIHSFGNGLHSFSASIEKPTPCHAITTQGVVMESFPEQFGIEINLIAPDPGIACIQVLDTEFIKMEFSGDEQARLTIVHLNGDPIPFEVFEENKL